MSKIEYNFRSRDYEQMLIGKTALEASCKLNTDDLRKLKIERDSEGNIDLLEVTSALVAQWKKSRKFLGDDADLAAMDLDLKAEKLLNERIKNQTRLQVLIPKVEAQNRVLRTLIKYREFLQAFIRFVAKDQVLEHKEIKPTVRAWQEYLTLGFNDLFDEIAKDEVEVKNWEEDGSAKLLRTRLQSAKTDNDFDDLLLRQGGLSG